MKEDLLSEFKERENNNLFDSFDNNEINTQKKNTIDEDFIRKNREGSKYSYYTDTFSSSYSKSFSYLEDSNEKSIYISFYNFKDFLILLSLLICPAFNFNYLYLPFIIIAFIYMTKILKNTMEQKRIKSNMEAIIFIYSILLIVFKLITFILKDKSFIEEKKSLFRDLGDAFLINKTFAYNVNICNYENICNYVQENINNKTEGVIDIYAFNIAKTIIGESIIFICCICSFIIRKICVFYDNDLDKKREQEFDDLNKFYSKMMKYIFVSFLFITNFATFNKSVLTMIYIVPFYIILFKYSVTSQKSIYKVYSYILYFFIFCIYFQILFINITNVYSIAHNFFYPYKNDTNFFRENWDKFGSQYAYVLTDYSDKELKDEILKYVENLVGYISGCLLLVILNFIHKNLSFDNYEFAKKNINEDNDFIFEVQKNCIIKLFNRLANFCSSPYFVLHVVRVLAIAWIYFHRSFYSLGVFLWLFFSFLYLNYYNIRTLAIYILVPMVFISLVSSHGGRIFSSYFNSLEEEDKIKFLRFALGVDKRVYFDYPIFFISNIFFYLIICFISLLNEKNNDIDLKDINEENKEENDIKKPLLKDVDLDVYEKVDEIKNKEDEVENNNNNDTNISNINIDKIKEENVDNDNKENEGNIELNEIIKDKENNDDNRNITLPNIIKKNIFINIDKITLVVMYYVANKEVNVIHLIFVIVFMIQLLTPQYIRKLCIFIIILFNALYLVEYVMDLLFVYFKQEFENNLNTIKIYLVPEFEKDEMRKSEIFIYGTIYCFYIHYHLYNNEYYQNLTLNEDMNLTNYIEKNLNDFPIIQKILYFIGNVLIEIYIWVIISCFIFFSCYFEINFLFAIKVLLFLLSIYQFIIFIQNHKFGQAKMDTKLPTILLIYCGVNTLVVYTYQVICIDMDVFDKIKGTNHFIFENFPNIGLTRYSENNLYYNLYPHFFSNFLSLLYIWEMKRMSNKFNNINKINISQIKDNSKNDDNTIKLSNDPEKYKKNEIEKEKENDEDIFNIDNKIENDEKEEEEEEVEEEDPRLSAFEKYSSNKKEMRFLNIKNFFSLIIISFTKLYWLFLFITTCIIYTNYDLLAGLFIYIFIFGITFMAMFHSIIKSLSNFIEKESYLISKVIRYYLVEKNQHISKNKYYRSISFRILLGYSLLLLLMYYLYGVFHLFQHGCKEDKWRGCEYRYCPIFDSNSNTEDLIKSISYLLGFYVNLDEKGIMSSAWSHLLFSALIAFDVYIQKIENYFTSCSVSNRKEYQKLLNENTKLKAIISSGDDNLISSLGKNLNSENESIYSNENEKSSESSFYSYNLSISKMSNKKEYDELFNKIKTYFANKGKVFNQNDEERGIKYITQFLEAFRKSSSKKVSLNSKQNKYKIIKAIKEIFEEIIIFFLLCAAIIKMNIWSFIYILISIYLISAKKTMMKYYVIFCFTISATFIQLIIFISNLQKDTDPRPEIESKNNIFDVIKERLKIPWYNIYFSNKIGFFLGMGVIRIQIVQIWMDFVLIVIMYIYLDYFSYSIYQEAKNKGNKNKGNNKINYSNLQSNQRFNLCLTHMSSIRFKKCNECMKYNLDIDLGDFNDFRNKILLGSAEVDQKNKKEKYQNNLTEIKEEDEKCSIINVNEKSKKDDESRKSDGNNSEDNIISTDSKNEQTNKSKCEPKKGNDNKERLKLRIKNSLENLYEIFVLSFHNIILIIIVIISMMISGLFSLFYITFSLYFLMTSNKIILGQKYYYPKAIKKILRVAILVDITIQIIYQTPLFSINQKSDDENILIRILEIIGVNKVINYGEKEDFTNFEIDSDSMILVIAKAITYFFMGLQILMYSSQYFQEHYLIYIITRKENLKRKSLMNVFRFNNRRINTMNSSLLIREEMSLSMNSLQKILDIWNNKLSTIDENANLQDNSSHDDENNKQSNNNLINEVVKEENDENNENEGEEEEGGSNIDYIHEVKGVIVDKETVRNYIRRWILDRRLIRLEKWIYKYAIDYSKMKQEEKEEYERDTIQGKIEVKTSIEKMVDMNLEKLELSEFNIKEMIEVKKFFDGTRAAELQKLEKQKKRKKEKSKRDKKNKYEGKVLADLENKTKNLDKFILNEGNEQEKEKEKNKEKNDKDNQDQEDLVDLTQPKFKILEKFIKTELFQRYLKSSYIIKCIINDFITFCIKKFHFLCYLVMILDHIKMSSLISLFYPLSIFCFALMEYPRPTKNYWKLCLTYSIIILSIKCFLQLELLVIIFEKVGGDESLYPELLETLEQYKVGLKFTESTFSYEFFKYIGFDSLVIIFLIINNYLLISNGQWDKREQEIENIYQAMKRVVVTKDLNSEENEKLNELYLGVKNEQLEERLVRNHFLKKNKEVEEEKEKKIKYKYLSFLKKATKIKDNNLEKEKKKMEEEEKDEENKINKFVTIDSFNENNKTYFQRLFPKIRNEKPGGDYYNFYTICMVFVIIYIVIFYTSMVQDITYNALSEETNQFNESMVIFILIHVGFLFYDRVININQNRNKLRYNYIFYDKTTKKPLTEKQYNNIKTQISRTYNYDTKREKFIIPPECAVELRKNYNLLYIQNEEFNNPLLQKYILHIFIVLFAHGFIFFYSPMKGNYNMNRSIYCSKDELENCNDFNYNKSLLGFYIIYIGYFIYSGLQIKFGFYDMKRKSMLKSGSSSINGTINTIYKSIPFLYEIKLAIDWTFTSTCLDLFQWNKFESIYDTVYTTYCAMSAKNISKVGQQIGKTLKVGMGATLSFGLIILLVGPILLFSSLNPTNQLNNLTGATLTIELSFFYENGAVKNYTLYQNSKPESIIDFKENDIDWDKYNYSQSSSTKTFPFEQVQKVKFSETSDRNWGLAKPQIENLIDILNWKNETENNIKEIQLIIDYQFERLYPATAKIAKDRKGIVIYDKEKNKTIDDDSEIGRLKNAISKCRNDEILFKDIYSPPIRLTANSDSRVIEDQKYFLKYDIDLGFTGCRIIDNETLFYDPNEDTYYSNSYLESYFTVKKNENNEKEGIIFHVFSDKVSTSISGYSVLTFYVSFILLAGTYVRNFFAGQPSKITLTEMPYCQEIINLCEGIKISRNSFDFNQEEKLYYILIELMRSPDYLRFLTESSVEQFNRRKLYTQKINDSHNLIL